jgi:cytosine/adenosine deaminase-related metal-dependent hydrolase
MEYVSGKILKKNGFKEGYLGFNKKIIVEKGKGKPPKKPISKGIIIPCFVNMHTHIGDSFIKHKNIKLPKDVEKLVAPPNGLKHQMLKKTPQHKIVEGMEKSINFMIQNGVNVFCDFRENGIMGISELKTAIDMNKHISSVILSRPDEMFYYKNEIDLLLRHSDGIGLSSISDWSYSEIIKIAKHVKKKNKIFALHASERIREDIDSVLDLKPDFLVHMNKATESDLTRVKENNIPLVLCPRSNNFFGLKHDYNLLKKIGLKLCIGSDNCMLNNPSVLNEIKYVKKKTNVFSLEELLNMVVFTPRKALNHSPNILGVNSSTDFVVLDEKNLSVLYNPKTV